MLPQIEEAGAHVIGVSPDAPDKAKELGEKLGLGFPLVSDEGLALTRRFGIAWQSSGRPLPVPAVYVVDASGQITFHYVHPDYRIRLHPDLLLAAVRTLAPAK